MDRVNSAAEGMESSNRDAIADEFELHVQQCTEQLQREGRSPAAARAEAERRFGDVARHHEQCRREAPEERMNTKARLILRTAVIAQAAAIAVLVTLVWRQDHSISDFRREMDVLKAQTRVQAIDSQAAQAVQRAIAMTPGTEEPAPVHLEGAVPRPGAYNLPEGGSLKVDRLVRAAGLSDAQVSVRVLPSVGGDTLVQRWKADGLSVRTDGPDAPCVEVTVDAKGAHPPLMLRGGELVIVLPAK
jgi:hypothetical protein